MMRTNGQRRLSSLGMAFIFAWTTLGSDFHRFARAQDVAQSTDYRVLFISMQRASGVSEIVPGRILEFTTSVMEMSGKFKVFTKDTLREPPKEDVVLKVKEHPALIQADEALWKGKELAQKGKFPAAVKAFKRAKRNYEKQLAHLNDFDKYVDAMLGITLSYFHLGHSDKAEKELVRILTVKPDLILDPRKVPQAALEATERLRSAYQPGFSGTLTITSKPPGAEIYLDGVRVGQSPKELQGLSRGAHLLRLISEGRKPWAKLFLASPKAMVLKPWLKRIPAPKAKAKITLESLARLEKIASIGRYDAAFKQHAKAICEHFQLQAIVLTYLRETYQDYELAPFLYVLEKDDVVAFDWIHLDHQLGNMQEKLLTLETNLVDASVEFPKKRRVLRRSKIYKRAPPPPKQKRAPKPVAVKSKAPARAIAAAPKTTHAPSSQSRTGVQGRKEEIAATESRKSLAPTPVVSKKKSQQPRPTPKPTPKPKPSTDSMLTDDSQIPTDPEALAKWMEAKGLGVPTPVSVSGQAQTESADAWYEKWWLWVIVGGAVAGAATAAIMLTGQEDTTNNNAFRATVSW